MNEAGRRLALFAAGLAAVFGAGVLLGATVGPDAGGDGTGGHGGHPEPDHAEMDHPATTTTTLPPPPPGPTP